MASSQIPSRDTVPFLKESNSKNLYLSSPPLDIGQYYLFKMYAVTNNF
jgi:hypothetical protein